MQVQINIKLKFKTFHYLNKIMSLLSCLFRCSVVNSNFHLHVHFLSKHLGQNQWELKRCPCCVLFWLLGVSNVCWTVTYMLSSTLSLRRWTSPPCRLLATVSSGCLFVNYFISSHLDAWWTSYNRFTRLGWTLSVSPGYHLLCFFSFYLELTCSYLVISTVFS